MTLAPVLAVPRLPVKALVFVLCVAPACLAHAAEPGITGTAEALPLPAGSEFSLFAYAQIIGVMLLVLLLLWAVLWFMRRAGRLSGVPRTDSMPRDGLYLERHINLAPRKGLVVVRFLNKRLLLGVTEQQITLLTEMDMHDESQPFKECMQSAALEIDVEPDVSPRV